MHGGTNEELWLSHVEETRPQIDLQERIWDELHATADIDTDDVTVWVEDFVATLNGSVRSPSARLAVQQTAEHVAGVRRVINELRVVCAIG